MKPGPWNETLDLAVIGNGRTAALLDTRGRLVWWCFPRFDSDTVFCRLLASDEEKGFTDVVLDRFASAQSAYLRNTATVVTTLIDEEGAAIRITDFAPRYSNFGRISRPPQLVRKIEPVSGLPRIVIRSRPTFNYGQTKAHRTLGSNHIRYWGADSYSALRLTSDAPLSYIDEETPFVLTRPVHLVFGVDESFPDELETAFRDLHQRTMDYWLEWVRRIAIGYDWQDAVIRAAITLKLCNYEETGGIVAALTTSIPEAPNTERNWDYRFCWLRDAYFVVKALNRIGATKTMEDFINFVLGIASEENAILNPCYSIVPSGKLDESVAAGLKGYRGHGPVRLGNAAGAQTQHDAYGSVILAAMPIFFDRRLPRPANPALFSLLEKLGNHSAKLALEPDAGIWEYRGRARIHTHSAAMCWAGCNRIAAIASHLGIHDRAAHWQQVSDEIQKVILERAWNEKLGAFTAALGADDDLDASVLLLPELGLIEAKDPRFVSTVNAMERELMRGKHVLRYARPDDFGMPETAFLVCRFWMIDALHALGRISEARDLFSDALKYRNSYGLLSEDIHPETGEMWGNFPQTYSLAGLILTAMRLSRSWEDRYWHASS
jgi:GH15 family glucan-1,4-alpha-glucosidase